MPAITVYCASSSRLDSSFHEVADGLGRELGRRAVTLVFGGGAWA